MTSSPSLRPGWRAALTLVLHHHALVTTTEEAPVGTASAVVWRLNVLGSLELLGAGRRVEVSGPVRTLLALLARNPGEVVGTAQLIADMWGGQPPEAAETTLASYAARLRKAIDHTVAGAASDEVVASQPDGYLLAIGESNVDFCDFERLLGEGRRALSVGQPLLAVARLDEALRLWRGNAYADVGDHAFSRAEASRLGELRLAAVESRVDAQLATAAPNVPAGLVAELEALVAEHPHRERLWVQLMTALYRLGRRGDAIAAFRQARIRLAEDLGVDVGPGLHAAERAVLAGDPALNGIALAATVVPEALAVSVSACVGRDEEIAWLETALDLAATRRGQARLIIGGPGLGKTRLIAEVAQRAAARGVSIRLGRDGDLDGLVAESDRLSLVIVDDLDLAPRDDLPRVVSFIRAASDRPVLILLTAKDPVRVGDLAGLPKLVLTALGDRAVADVVRLYAPGTTDATAVAAMVNTGGVPARVHRAASEWAFARAGRRIDRAVVDASEPSRWLTSVRDEVVAGILDLEHVRARARVLRPFPLGVVACPYKGLATYEAGDAALFHGRERLVAELVARLVGTRLVAVVGESGAGKSSLVRAGLQPALAAGVLPDSGQWRQIAITPATAGDLRARLAAHSSDAAAASAGVVAARGAADSVLLVVDQFEEAFTALDAPRRKAFLTTMTDLVSSGRARAVITLRSDFYARCVQHPLLARLVTANTLLVPPMSVAELRRAIEHPAAAAGLSIEDGLVDELADDVRDVPGGLALLSSALLLLWEDRSERALTLAGYRSVGGVAGAVEAYAERAFAAFSTEQREAARRILVHLADTGGDPPVRRRARRSELESVGGVQTDSVLELLANRGLVIVADDVVDVVHEAVFTHWPRLRGWLDDDAVDDRMRANLAAAASAWTESGGDPALLHRGPRLVAEIDWALEHPGQQSGAEGAFLAAGQQAMLAVELRRQRVAQRLRQLLAAAVLAFVVAVAGVVLAVTEQGRADAAGVRADARRLTSDALAESDPRLAALLAVAATKLDDSAQIRDGMRAVLLRRPDLAAAAGVTGTDRITALALSPDGATLAAATVAGPVLLHRADGLGVTARLAYPTHGPVNGVAFTPDGRRLVSWGGSRTWTDNQAPTSIVVWDLATGSPIGAAFGEVWPDSGGGLLADGVTLLLKQQHLADGKPATAVAWNIDARTPSTAYELPATAVDAVLVAPGGRHAILGAPGGAIAMDPAAGVSRELRGAAGGVALSPDGNTLLAAEGHDIAVWDTLSGERRATGRQHLADVVALAWAADGRAFASAGADGLLLVWNATTLRPSVVAGGGSPARVVQFSADAKTLYTAGDDGTLLAWDLTASRGLGVRLRGDTDPMSWARLACTLAGRDMTRAEWSRHVPDRPYQHVCPG